MLRLFFPPEVKLICDYLVELFLDVFFFWLSQGTCMAFQGGHRKAPFPASPHWRCYHQTVGATGNVLADLTRRPDPHTLFQKYNPILTLLQGVIPDDSPLQSWACVRYIHSNTLKTERLNRPCLLFYVDQLCTINQQHVVKTNISNPNKRMALNLSHGQIVPLLEYCQYFLHGIQ